MTLGRQVHRWVWQSLPRGARRRAFVTATRLLAPKPDPEARPTFPIIVVGFLTAATGLGQSARLCLDALRTMGVPALGVDLSLPMRQGGGVDYAFDDGRTHAGPATLILHVNGPFVPMAMMLLGRGFLRDKHVVGYWAWELARAPDDWRAGLTFVHRVLVPSLFTRTAILGLGAPLDVDVLAHPVATQDHGADVQPHAGGSVFTVLTVFNMASGFERKNPIAAVQAFRRAFGASLRARLIVKSVNADHHSKAAVALRSAIAGADNIRHIESTLSPAHLLELYAGSDVVISLHRAEGFGLTIAEGMLASRCVVATDYSGSTDFLSMETGRPIPYRLVPAREPGGEYDWPDQRWAEADVGSAAVTLEELASNSALRRDLGTAAREAALDRFSATAYTQRLLGLLNLDTTMLTTGGAPPQLP